jgi:hypothetical protein
MLRSILASIVFTLPLAAQADDLLLSDLKAQGGVQLSVDDLKQLLTDAKVVSYYEESTRRWKNDADGKFVASGSNGPEDPRAGAATYSRWATNITASSRSPTARPRPSNSSFRNSRWRQTGADGAMKYSHSFSMRLKWLPFQ